MFLLRPGPGGREVLLQLRRGTGYMDEYWAAAAAGHVEEGESVHAAGRREALEELGLTEVTLEPWCTMQRTGATGEPVDERVDYFFTSTSWSGAPRIMEPERCADLRWFGLDALPTSPQPVVPHELQVLTSIRAGSTPAFVSHGFDD